MNQETTIETTIANVQTVDDLTNDELTIDGELETDIATPMTREAFKHYHKMLRIMDSIHNEIADKVNSIRQGKLIGYFSEENKYIPETKENDFYSLMLEVAAQDKVKLPLP
jgi:hypothetical protein